MAKTQKTGRGLKAKLAIIGLISITGLALLAIVTNWAIYKNMQISQQIRDEKLARLRVMEKVSRLTETASLLIDNSASSGTDISLMEAERYIPDLLAAVSAAKHKAPSQQETARLDSIQILIGDVYSSGRSWVEAVISMELAGTSIFFTVSLPFEN